MKKILVIGGYGQVGRSVCDVLGERYPARVIAAGRNLPKAQAFANTTRGRILSRAVDVEDDPENTLAQLSDVCAVVMCLDQRDTCLAERILASGISYIDVSATYAFQRELKRRDSVALGARSTAVVGVGLCPGITTLMAYQCARQLEHPRQVEISLLLGAGDNHGHAAIRWTVENFLTKQIGPSPVRVDFGKPWGKRVTIPVAFSDQFVLREGLKIDAVFTRLAMDSRVVMGGFRLLRCWSPRGRIHSFLIGGVFARILGAVKIGSESFIVKVDAVGMLDGRERSVSMSYRGRREAEVTGKVAAAVAQLLMEGTKPSGVFDIHEVVTLDEIQNAACLSLKDAKSCAGLETRDGE